MTSIFKVLYEIKRRQLTRFKIMKVVTNWSHVWSHFGHNVTKIAKIPQLLQWNISYDDWIKMHRIEQS
ncbi:hypothetical protein DRP04_15490 [Archaeoglobales archaeon]|nr:MAG: hypothetical protein DRP04_15490 [Archaeoglobales archaeon]